MYMRDILVKNVNARMVAIALSFVGVVYFWGYVALLVILRKFPNLTPCYVSLALQAAGILVYWIWVVTGKDRRFSQWFLLMTVLFVIHSMLLLSVCVLFGR